MKNAASALAFATSLWACGGGAPAPEPKAPQASTQAAVEPTEAAAAPMPNEAEAAAPADAAADTPRARDAATWLKNLESVDLGARGIAAMNGLSEEQFGLSALLRKGMDAATAPSIDPSQSGRIVQATLEDGADDVVKKLCGSGTAALVKATLGVPEAGRVEFVVEQCKLQSLVDVKNIPKGSFIYPLLSAVVQKLFEAEGGHSKAEFELAKLVAVARRTDH
jgi:hypothetical protein